MLTMSIYRDHKGEFRWRIVAANGAIVGDSGESYKRKSACVRMAEKVCGGCDWIEDTTDT